MRGHYLISSIDQHLAVASCEGGAVKAYNNPAVNTVLVPSPLAGQFNYASKYLTASEIDACKPHLELFAPEERDAFKALSNAQQDLILDIQDKEPVLSNLFEAIVGAGAFIDSHRYVQSRREMCRTAIPHIDQCDTHMAATLLGKRGTLVYLRDFTDACDADFKRGRIKISPRDFMEVSPEFLCFMKGTDHADIYKNRAMTSRWHASPIVQNAEEARLGSFYAMKNGLGCGAAYG